MADEDDSRGPPTSCPACGADVVDVDGDLVCDHCDRAVFPMRGD